MLILLTKPRVAKKEFTSSGAPGTVPRNITPRNTLHSLPQPVITSAKLLHSGTVATVFSEPPINAKYIVQMRMYVIAGIGLCAIGLRTPRLS